MQSVENQLSQIAQSAFSSLPSETELTSFFLEVPLDKLLNFANQLRHEIHGEKFDLCSIINVKSGRCSEDCAFCSQSVHYNTEAPVYPFKTNDEILDLAIHNESKGVHRYSLVASGRGINESDLQKAEDAYNILRRKTSLSLCASLGVIDRTKAERLKSAGVSTYHHNLETSRSHYKKICTTHDYEDRVQTLKEARAAGLSLCSGGILGLGETFAQRIELALALRELEILSIPINILDGIEGTPLQGQELPSVEELLRSIAAFRIINPHAYIRLAGGRRHLGEALDRAFQGGVDAAIVGDFLTTLGASINEDLARINKSGFSPQMGKF